MTLIVISFGHWFLGGQNNKVPKSSWDAWLSFTAGCPENRKPYIIIVQNGCLECSPPVPPFYLPLLLPLLPHRYFNSGSAPLECDKEFWDLRDSVVQCELLILRQLNFHVSFEHPHKVGVVCIWVFVHVRYRCGNFLIIRCISMQTFYIYTLRFSLQTLKSNGWAGVLLPLGRCFCPKWLAISTFVTREKPQHITVDRVKGNIQTVVKHSSEDRNCNLSKIL